MDLQTFEPQGEDEQLLQLGQLEDPTPEGKLGLFSTEIFADLAPQHLEVLRDELHYLADDEDAMPAMASWERFQELDPEEQQVFEIITKRLQDITPPDNEPDRGEWIMRLIRTEEQLREAAQIQSLRISLANALEYVARDLVALHPERELVNELRGWGVRGGEPLPTKGKSAEKAPRVWTRLPRAAVEREAQWVMSEFMAAVEDDPGNFRSSLLDRLVDQSRQRLIREPLEEEMHPYFFDIGMQVHRERRQPLMLLELKSSGRLDNKNAKDELRNLLRAVLSADPRRGQVRAGAALTYQPERETSLKKYFPAGRLLQGDEFWGPLLPSGVTTQQFQALVGRALHQQGLTGR